MICPRRMAKRAAGRKGTRTAAMLRVLKPPCDHRQCRLLTVDDLAEMIHKPKNTIYKHRAMGTGPLAMRVGKSLLFWDCDVRWWLKGLEDEP
jgi:hypothetical protein